MLPSRRSSNLRAGPCTFTSLRPVQMTAPFSLRTMAVMRARAW